jgi:hypothetical protein
MFQMIKQAYSEEALGHSAVFGWHKRFAQGRNSLEDDEHTDQPIIIIAKKEETATVQVKRQGNT